jgi:hypothetical protein
VLALPWKPVVEYFADFDFALPDRDPFFRVSHGKIFSGSAGVDFRFADDAAVDS